MDEKEFIVEERCAMRTWNLEIPLHLAGRSSTTEADSRGCIVCFDGRNDLLFENVVQNPFFLDAVLIKRLD